MNFKHFSAVKTLNGKSEWWLKKWRFSVTKASLPVHSVYAAIKASAGLNPFASYLKTISKGTTISSSTVVIVLIKLLNSWKASTDKFRLTSSNIVRGIRMVCSWVLLSNLSRKRAVVSSFNDPKAYIYSLESMTKRSFLLPDSFSCFTQSCYNLLFAHFKNRRRVISDYLSEFLQMFKCLVNPFHYQSPQHKVYYRINLLSNR